MAWARHMLKAMAEVEAVEHGEDAREDDLDAGAKTSPTTGSMAV